MHEVLETLRPGSHHKPPTIRVRCGSCTRIYVTTGWRSDVKTRRYCMACRQKNAPRSPHGRLTLKSHEARITELERIVEGLALDLRLLTDRITRKEHEQ